MQHLPFPVTADDDDAELDKLANNPAWTPHQAAWLAAYQTYRNNAGNPFTVAPYNFGPGVHDRQYALYDTRKGSGELRRMRRKEGLKSCPVCGSPVTGDLDHYLPRAVYPEFSIMRANLLPACRHCNLGVKGTTVHGADPRRFIHPYFDDWAEQAIWYVEIVQPFRAAQFRPRALPGLVPPRDEIVAFHLDNVLGSQFHASMRIEWSSLPTQIKLRDQLLSIASVTHQIDLELRVALAAKGAKSWQAALLRGIQCDPNTIEYLPGIEKLRLTPAQINNGEVQTAPRREFGLLGKDEAYLNERSLHWETFVDGGRRWLLLSNFVLPEGYNHSVVDIAIDVPPTYPRSEIDMFHCFPHLKLGNGRVIGETSGRTAITGRTFQQWSRHLNGQTRWNPATDSLMTHIAVIEAALLKEVGE